ncbi:hypothetical protein LTR94_026647, partial [Friedmanniomyces endolithicus]
IPAFAGMTCGREAAATPSRPTFPIPPQCGTAPRIMLNLNGITVRLGGRTILDSASAALPPGSRVGLIGRNGAGKSTMVRVIAGLLEPDDGTLDMPRGARIGYIAQEAPAGDSTPFDTVLAADTERAALFAEAETCEDMDRLGDIHERLIAIDAHAAPARAAPPAPSMTTEAPFSFSFGACSARA